ncbi:NAD(P)-dependent oxidoreductase [Actinomadura macrotermitis]|uniref:2-hydroxy-3-oxopropionate reductase n=1 Tax=Actinomadura macrotermitis TaxID=2585200 RepID=A0A7K0BRG0_9ACTN|nr:NAD(P)-binding domain-containing protein [Actinomadura macrotermitis]MQY03304.1 2-hydroxy-3-oxopropionate reductase [Actinomadura macrotermitis]
MSKIAFIGLGIMGAPMAAHLVRAGHEVTGYDVAPKGLDALVAAGGSAAGDVAGAVAGAEIVITMLPQDEHVEEVVFGGLLDAAGPGALYIDFSTIRPETSIRVAEAGRERGLRVLDAPVSGGEKGAVDAVLSIMVGGAEADFEAARPVFAAVGKTFERVGGNGAGQYVKAANQLIVGGTYGLVAEAIVLMEAAGVDAGAGLDVIAGGLAASRILELKRGSMLARRFEPGFRIDLHHKDMGIATAAARTAGVSLPLTGMVAQLVAAARAQGHGALDHSALLKVVEDLSGRAS